MQSPDSPSVRPKKRTQRKRTVYTDEQLTELEKFFEKKHYGSYEERETLAAGLNLQETEVQLWLKNRGAKERKLQKLRKEQNPGFPAEPQGRSIYSAAPVPAGLAFQGLPASPANPELRPTPAFPEEPVFSDLSQRSGGPGFFSPASPRSLQVSPEAESSVFNYSQGGWHPAQSYPGTVPAAPVPAPAPARVSPQVPYDFSFNPDPFVIPAVTEQRPRPPPLEGFFITCDPWSEEEEGTREYLNL